MKKERDSDDGPKKKRSQIDEFVEMWDEQDSEGEQDDRYLKWKDGKNTIRVLPHKDAEEPFFVSWAIHWNMGPDKDEKFRCIEPGGPFGHSKKKDKQRNYKARVCPACKLYCKGKTKSRAFPWQSKEGKAYWRKHVAPYRAKHRFIFAVNRPKSAEDKRKVQVVEVGPMIAQPLITAFYDKDMGGDFTDPRTGRNIVVVKTKLGREQNEVEYKVNIVPDRTPLKLWKKLKKKLPDLESFLPESLEPDAIIAIMEGDGSSSSDDDDRPRKKKGKKGRDRDDDDDLDDIDDDDDDDDEKERRLKLKKRKRGRDEDVDPDAEEEDDEDEKPRKKKGKKSKMRDKLRKKARRNDDEDEDDDDDEGDDDEDDDADDSDEDDDDGDSDSEDDEEDEDDDDSDEEDEDDDD